MLTLLCKFCSDFNASYSICIKNRKAVNPWQCCNLLGAHENFLKTELYSS